jgi:Na+/melibiose symporter-like transporter
MIVVAVAATLRRTPRRNVMRSERPFLSNVGLVGAIALLALVANGLLDNRLPAAWIFAVAIFGTLGVAATLTATAHRSTRRR